MKRSIFSGLLVAAATFFGLTATPAFAINTPPAPPAGCIDVTPGAGWPASHVFRCGTASAADGTLMYTILNNLYALQKTEMKGLAGSTNRGNFYIFGTQQEYKSSTLNAFGSPSSIGTAALTAYDPGTVAPLFSAAWVKDGQAPNPQPNEFVGNAIAHELGHWLDVLEGTALSRQQKITFDGVFTPNHFISIFVAAGNIPGSPLELKVNNAVSLADLATKFAALVNTPVAGTPGATLKNLGFTASASGNSFTLTNPAGYGPTYSYSGVTTERVWLDMGLRATDQALFLNSLNNADIPTFNGVQNCNTTATGVFTKQRDAGAVAADNFKINYICSTVIQATVGGGGPAHAGLITLKFTDDRLAGSPLTISVNVAANEAPATTAQKLVNQINVPQGPLENAKIKAIYNPGANTFKLETASGYGTTYVFNGGTTTVTLQMQVPNYGTAEKYTFNYSAANSNYTNLIKAWPKFFDKPREVFAEYYAILAGYKDTNFLDDGTSNDRSLDHYLLWAPAFTCINNLINTTGNTRKAPTAFPAGCPIN